MGGARGGGKLAPLWSKVLTPFGFVEIGSLKVGDQVTDPTTGGTCRVIGVFPQGKRDVYKITCDDGAVTYAGLEHLWAYKLPSPQREFAVAPLDRWDSFRVGTTEELAGAISRGFNPSIPLPSWDGGPRMMREIVSIEKFSHEEAVCIGVSSPYGLYVADDYIVTHNSYFLVGDVAVKSLQYGQGARALLLRRTLGELTELHRVCDEIYTPFGATFAPSKELWTFPNGATVRLAYLDDDSDVQRYQGHAYSYIGVDECGNFPSPVPLDKLFGSLRSPEGHPTCRRMTCNPGGPGHGWVFDRYVKYGAYVWRKWRPQPELAPHIFVDSIFIPARLEDNPALLKADPNYEQSLAMMGDPALYRMMRFGDWNQQAGTYFSLFDKEKHCKPCPEIKPWWPRYIGGDWGFSSWSTFYWGAWDGERLWVYRELSRQRLDPKALAKEVLLANGSDKISRFFFSPDAAGLRNSERSIVDEMNDVFSEFNTIAGEILLPKIEPAADDRVAGWQIIYQGFRTETLLISPNCVRLIDTIPTLIRNPKKPEDILKCPTDHWADGLRYLVFSRMQTDAEEPKDIRIKNFIAEATDPNVAAMRARLAEADGRFMTPVRFSGRRFV